MKHKVRHSRAAQCQQLLIWIGLFAMANVVQAQELSATEVGAPFAVAADLRLGYLAQTPDVAGEATTRATAVAGSLRLTSRPWHQWQWVIAPYFVEKVATLSGNETNGKLNGDFFDAQNDSYAYLAEAYVHYGMENGFVRYGRQLLDTPFINTDNIRLHPNSFEALWANYIVQEGLGFELGYVRRWAGFDSGASQEQFKMASGKGVVAGGLIWQMNPHHTFSAWFYDFDTAYRLSYAEAVYANGPFEAAIQYADFAEQAESGIDGQVRGVQLSYQFGELGLSMAYNRTENPSGMSVENGLGGGNFFTSMEEMTIAGATGVTATVVGVDYRFSDGFNASMAYGHFEDAMKSSLDLDEQDLVLAYVINRDIDAELVWAKIQNSAAPASAQTNFSRQFVRVNVAL